MPEGAALSWPLSDIVIRRKNGFAFRCRVRGCSLLDQRPVSALPRRRRERYRQTTSPEGVKIGRRSGVKFGSRLTVLWPVGARAQQAGLPLIGILSGRAPETDAVLLGFFRDGLKQYDYIEGHNVAIEYRWVSGDYAIE